MTITAATTTTYDGKSLQSAFVVVFDDFSRGSLFIYVDYGVGGGKLSVWSMLG